MRLSALAIALLIPSSAFAAKDTTFHLIDPKCVGLTQPANYDEQTQADFAQNFFALSASYSPIHAAIPHASGHGSISIDVSILPPLSCGQRYVLDWTKTEDTNKSPILPKIGAGFSFPTLGKIVVPYASVAFFPPIPFNGTRNYVLSGEIGLGIHAHEFIDVGGRLHTSVIRTYGDIAGAFTAAEPVVEDVYMGTTWGVDALISAPLHAGKQELSPYIAVGYLNASTFFLIGDDRYVGNNLHPYSGLAFSGGLDALFAKHFRFGAEFYGAPGGYSKPDKTAADVTPGSRYGHIYTGRLRLGVEF